MNWQKVWTGVNALALLTVVSACGEDNNASNISCGEGTVAKNNTCVVAEPGETLECGEGTVQMDGKCLPKETLPPLTCGDQTLEKDGKCVADLDTIESQFLPNVDSIALKELTIANVDEPKYVLHQANFSAKIEVSGAESFNTEAVIVLKAGDDICAPGVFSIAYTPAKDGKAQVISVEADAFLQQSCEALAGKEVSMELAFDPFGQTLLKDRKLTTDKGLEGLLVQSILPKDDCATGACDARVDLQANPGRNAQIVDEQLNTRVAVLQTLIGNTPATVLAEDNVNPSGGASDVTVGTAPPPTTDPRNTEPHFNITTLVQVLGLNRDEKLGEDAMYLAFDIRPTFADGQAPVDFGLSESDVDWKPLDTELQQESRAGEEPTKEYLREQFLADLQGPTIQGLHSPIFITGDTRTEMVEGNWKAFEQFELRACVKLEFTEASIDGVADDNCASYDVFVLRRNVNASTDTPETPQTTNAAHQAAVNYSWGRNFGSYSSVFAGFDTNLQIGVVKSDNANVYSLNTNKGAYGHMHAYVKSEILNLGLRDVFRAYITAVDSHNNSGTGDRAYISAKFYSYQFVRATKSWPDGDYEISDAVVELAYSLPLWGYAYDYDIIKFNLGIALDGTVGITPALVKNSLTPDDPCADSTAVDWPGDSSKCIRLYKPYVQWQTAKSMCIEKGGWLSTPYTQAQLEAISNRRDGTLRNKNDGVWLGFYNHEAPTYTQNTTAYTAWWTDYHYTNDSGAGGPRLFNRATFNWHNTVAPNTQAGRNFGAQNNRRALSLSTYYPARVKHAPENWIQSFSCTFNKSNVVSKGEVGFKLTPYATLSLSGGVGASVNSGWPFYSELAAGNLGISVKLMEWNLPIQPSLVYQIDDTFTFGGWGRLLIETELKGLGGDISVDGHVAGIGFDFTIYEWDDISYAKWTLTDQYHRIF